MTGTRGKRSQRRSPDQVDELWSTQWMIQANTGNLTWWLRLIDYRIGYPATQESQGDEIRWWIAQMILGVPIPALFVYEIAALLLCALPQTLINGSSAGTGGLYSH